MSLRDPETFLEAEKVAPPVAVALPVPDAPPRPPPTAAVIWRDLGLSLLVLVASFGGALMLANLDSRTPAKALGLLGGFAACLFFLFTVVRSLVTGFRAMLYPGPVAARDWAGILSGVVFGLVGAFFAMISAGQFSRGRQLRRRGKLLLPRVETGSGWTAIEGEPAIPAGLRKPLAAQWRENGRTEHASVAAFAQLTLELMALGAPPELLADVQRDALDEIRHAELCFSLARALDGEPKSPGAFPAAQSMRRLLPSRTLALARLAVDALVEGALLEGFSARVLSQLLPGCSDHTTARLLRELEVDEACHARHGWDVLRWCLEEGGAPVAFALQGAVGMLPVSVDSTLAGGARDGAWECFGIPGQVLENEAFLQTREQVVRRIQPLIGAPAAKPLAA